MHLLFVTSIVPHGAPATGYEIANAAIISALRRAGVRVTVMGYSWPGKAPADPQGTILLGEVDVETAGASTFQRIQWLGRAVAGGRTFSSAKMRVVSEARIREAMRSVEPFDGYVLNSVQMAGAFPSLFADKPSIYIAHNVEHLSARENAAAAHGLQKVLFAREARLLHGMEHMLCKRAAFVFTLAEDDAVILSAVRDRSRFAVLPLVTRETVEPPAQDRIVECDAALIGTWSWAPNRIGLDWFLNEVTPKLPDTFTTRIAGNIPADVRPAHPGVTLVGRVADATAFVRSAAVIPLISRAGTGVQLKTIETFELGLPSVATTRSLRAIAHLPENCTVCDDAADFAAALVRIAAERQPVADGRAFHAAQRAALDAAVRSGLARLEITRQREKAA
ncbi:MAG: glycosyltransferase family 4 protein [Notoacmeibacter sp.]|nr:glycosyltransferase family 4 protein [Notoacmeibacter sp.]